MALIERFDGDCGAHHGVRGRFAPFAATNMADVREQFTQPKPHRAKTAIQRQIDTTDRQIDRLAAGQGSAVRSQRSP